MTVLVFANGEIADTRWIEPHLAGATAVLAADGGLRHVRALGRWPDVIIGDMDSLPPAATGELPDSGVALIRYPRDKDETDLELALTYAAENYSEPIRIFGATGGRFDQTLANVLLLALPALAGRDVRVVEPREEIWLVTSRTTVEGEVGDVVSLIAVGGDVAVAQTTGLRWPLHNATLEFGLARGVSNELVAPQATVAITSGRLICVHRFRPT